MMTLGLPNFGVNKSVHVVVCRLLVVAGELGGLLSKLLEDVVGGGVHDGHGFGGDANVRV